MTIQKGRDWGKYVTRPDGLCVVSDDFAASDYLSHGSINPDQPIDLAIANSGMARVLGIRPAKRDANEMLRTEFDVVEATYSFATGSRGAKSTTKLVRRYFLGHAIVRGSLLTGTMIAVLNSSFVGKRDWAPRAHPNDGKFDVVELDATMSLRQRVTALRLMKSGSHLPHPKIHYRQFAEYSVDCSRPPDLYIDGRRIGRVGNCSFRLIPSAVNLYW